MPGTKARINVNMSVDSLKELKRLAAEAGMDMSQFVRDSVRVYGAIRREVKRGDGHLYVGDKDKVLKEVIVP